MIKLPRDGHPVRLLTNCDRVRAFTSNDVRWLPTVREGKTAAKEYLKTQPREVEHISTLVRHEDGQVLLVTYGRRGGWVTRWNFGRPDATPAL